MRIRCWGARGSIPVSGREYLKYGGDTTCLELRTESDEIIIIDAGSGIRRLGSALLEEERYRYTMLFTHAHWDHLLGFPFFKPVYVKGANFSVYGCPFAQTTVRNMLSRIMVTPNFPVNFEDIQTTVDYHTSCGDLFTIHGIDVATFPISHPNQGVGYSFTEKEKTFVFLTDNELGHIHDGGRNRDYYGEICSHVDLLIHDAEYLPEDYEHTKSWGHSLYTQTVQLAIDAKVKKLGLFHHNQDRSDEAVDAIVADCRRIITEQQSPLECFAVYQDMELDL